MRDRQIVGAILLLTLVAAGAAGGVWFYHNFEKVETEVRRGYSEQARRNPLLAAERFLDRIGVSAKSITAGELWRHPPDPDETLLFFDFSWPKDKARRQKLHRWLEQGGNLIFAPLSEKDRSNPLQHELGFELHEDGEFKFDETPLDFVGSQSPATVKFLAHRYLVDKEKHADVVVKGEEGIHLLQYPVGEGWVTVLSDTRFLRNSRIAESDHAYALARLVGPRARLIYDLNMPSLLSLLWRYAPHALVAVLAAVGLWLWGLGRRLGPILPPEGMRRRDLAEHLSANAVFLWRMRQGPALFHSNQQRLEQAWLGKHLALRSMDGDERCHWIGERAGLAPEAVRRALYGEFNNEREFIELSGYQQLLRTTLCTHSR